MSEHENATSRPWSMDESMADFIQCDAGGLIAMVLVIDGKTERANAALIVEAVNAYDTLCAENERLTLELASERESVTEWKRFSMIATRKAVIAEAANERLRAALFEELDHIRDDVRWADGGRQLERAMAREEAVEAALSEAQP